MGFGLLVRYGRGILGGLKGACFKTCVDKKENYLEKRQAINLDPFRLPLINSSRYSVLKTDPIIQTAYRRTKTK